jgi:class 3 adenylate cyclase
MNQNKISFGINKKLISLVMVVSIISISSSAFLSFNSATEVLEERIKEQLTSESTIRGNSILSLIHTRILQMNVLSTDPMIRSLVHELNQIEYQSEYNSKIQDKKNDFLIQVQDFQETVKFSIGFEDVKVIGNDGRVFFSLVRLDKTDNFSQDSRFLQGLKAPFVDFVKAPNTASKMIVTVPIFGLESARGSESIGVIIATLRTDDLNAILLDRGGLGDSGKVYLVNEDFFMISESRFVEDAPFNQIVDTLPVRECFENSKTHNGIYLDYRGKQIFGSTFCAKDLGFILLAEIDQEEILEPVSVLQNKILLAGFSIMGGMIILAVFLSKLLSKRLIKLSDAANEIAKGNFGIRTNIKARDEIGHLSLSFDLMAQKLQESLIEIKEKEDVIKQQEDILLKFSQHIQNDCVGVIDMKDSTKISAELSDEDVTKLYEIFLNFMAKIVRKYNGEVLKTIGDALLFRFPNVDLNDPTVMKNILECCFSMIESHDDLKEQLKAENLPELNYKVSMTYGSVKVAQSTTSNVSDIFGPTVNRCFKINSLCPENNIVIGDNMYKILKAFHEYEFVQLCVIEMKQKYGYTIFVVSRKGLV